MKHTHVFIWLLVGIWCLVFSNASFAQDQGQYDEIVVNFVDDATQEMIQQIEAEYGIDLVYNSIFSEPEELCRFPIAGKNPEELQQLMDALTAEEEIEYAEPNYLYQAYFTPNDPMYAKQWNMTMIGIEEAWETGTGEDAIVAVIDTGVAYEDYTDKKGTYHRIPDLAQTKFVQGYDFIDDDEHANDDNAHGSHVAGTIAQSTNNALGVTGIAFKASIMPLKVLSKFGYGNVADIAEAITYAADHGAHIINMSLGGPSESKLMREAVEYAHKKGVTIICAAGNESRNRASYPAAYPYSIAVSSVGPDGELAPYSNYGKDVDIAAPGGNTKAKQEDGILQNTIGRADPTKDSYEYFQGTSMASPHVAGVAALIVSLGVKEPDQVEKILLNTATKKGDDPTNKFGAGILNAAAAVQKAASLGEELVQPAQPETAPVQPEAPTMQPETPPVTSAAVEQKSPIRFSESLLYFIAGIGFALFYFKLLKRGDGWGRIFSFLYFVAMFLASSGLFFVDFLPTVFIPRSLIHFISSSLPNLDRLFLGHTAASMNPLFHSAIIPFILMVTLLGSKKGKAIAIGVAVGMAAHLFVDTFFSFANVAYIPGTFLLDKAWLIVNGLICFGLALLAEEKP